MANILFRVKLLIAMLLVSLCSSAQPYKWRYNQHVDFSNVNNLDSLANVYVEKLGSDAFFDSYDLPTRFRMIKDTYDIEYEMGEFGVNAGLPFMMLPKKVEKSTLEDRALSAKCAKFHSRKGGAGSSGVSV